MHVNIINALLKRTTKINEERTSLNLSRSEPILTLYGDENLKIRFWSYFEFFYRLSKLQLIILMKIKNCENKSNAAHAVLCSSCSELYLDIVQASELMTHILIVFFVYFDEYWKMTKNLDEVGSIYFIQFISNWILSWHNAKLKY